MKWLKRLIPSGIKSGSKRFLHGLGYDLVYYEAPGTHHRYPYGDQCSFLSDIRKRNFSIENILDIGANTGEWSLSVAEHFPNARAVLVEPQVELEPVIRERIKKHSNWKVLPIGIAGKSGVRRFRACADTVSSSFIVSDGENDDTDSEADIRILPVDTLDNIWRTHFDGLPISLLKIDAEGLELEILKSGVETLERTDMVMLEVAFFQFREDSPRFSELVAEMDRNGFSIYDFTMFYRRPFDSALGLMDCVFVSERCALRAANQW